MAPQDYTKLKNADLVALLKQRSLPHTGKKDEMVARLKEHDASSASTTTASATPATAPAAKEIDDEITLDDDLEPSAPAAAAAAPTAQTTTTGAVPPKASEATTKHSKDAISAGGTATRVPNPQSVPNQAPAIDPSKTSDLSTSKDTSTSKSAPLASTPAPTTTAAPTTDATKNPTRSEKQKQRSEKAAADAARKADEATRFAAHLPTTSIDEEIARRRKRAEKFGLDVGKDETIKNLERAKRFGAVNMDEVGKDGTANGDGGEVEKKGAGLLDKALPEGRRERKRKSDAVDGVGNGESYDDPGLKRQRVRANPRGRGGRGPRQGERSEKSGGGGGEKKDARGSNDGAGQKTGGGKAGWMSEKDRAAAEARKNRFG